MSDRKYVAALYHVGDSEFVPYDATDIAAPDNETAIARARAWVTTRGRPFTDTTWLKVKDDNDIGIYVENVTALG